jgi:replicative DNA helicase
MNGTKTNAQRNGVRKKEYDLTSLVYGKIPPNAMDIEEAILGAIMLEKEAIDRVIDMLKPECFYKDQHKLVFEAMKSLYQKMIPIDIMTVTEELRKTGSEFPEGTAYFVTRLTNCVASSANIEHHSRIVLDKYILREMIRIGGEMISDAYEPMTDSFEILDKMDQDLSLVTSTVHTKNYHFTGNLLVQAFQQIEHIRSQPDRLTGIPSGFREIDKLTHGWQDQDLIILAARPSVGKTALALNLAMNAAMSPWKPTPVGFFSMEMSAMQCIYRLMSASSEVSLTNMQRGRLDNDQIRQLYSEGVQKLSNAEIYIDDSPALNILQIRSKARKMKRKHNIGILFVDYLQLMSGSGKKERNRENEISEISRGLKGLAKELNIPVVALSQLSRETEKRSEKIPQLSDLRESGAIEQDADIVCFIYRPEYYQIHKTPTGETTAGETHLNFAKNRNGTLDTVKIKAQLWIQKFVAFDSLVMTEPKKKETVKGEVNVNSWLESERDKLRGQVEEPTDDLPF